ncbi:MAG TPA: hypothetical protein VGL59_24960 [Polyangia bacterium]
MVVGVVVVATVATVVDSEAKDAAFARDFDGWVSVSPWQKIHLEYSSGMGREIPLTELTSADALGVRAAHLSDADGLVRLYSRASPSGQHPEGPPPEPKNR